MDSFLKKFIWVIIAAPVIYLAVLWNSLPEKVPMHFDLHGNIDRYGSRNELLGMSALLTGISVLVYLLLNNIYRIDPKKYAAENKDRLRRISYAVVMLLAGVHTLILYSTAHGSMQFSARYILAGVGFLFAIIGNYMPHLKPNYFAGFRLPWTLESEYNWRKTHILGGKLWFAGGLLAGVLCLLLPIIVAIVVFFTIMIILVAIPMVYSYRLYKQQRQQSIR